MFAVDLRKAETRKNLAPILAIMKNPTTKKFLGFLEALRELEWINTS